MGKGLRKFPFIAQHDAMDCGPACLAMLSRYYGKQLSLQFLRDNAYLTKDGVSLLGLTEAADSIGLKSMALHLTVDELIAGEVFPAILFWNNQHFVVLYGITRNAITGKYHFKIADPAAGYVSVPMDKLKEAWVSRDNEEGVVFVVKPTDKFNNLDNSDVEATGLKGLLRYVKPHKLSMLQLILILAIGSVLTLVFPFLTQALVDNGVDKRDLNVVFLILIAQVFVFLGSAVIEIVRNWVVLYLGTTISVTIISDFLKKIMRLPIKFFDTKFTGDFYQRINDHSRIESFLTSQSLTTFFSLINFLIFFLVLLNYDLTILLIYVVMTAMAIIWFNFFFRRRAILDYFRFKTNALNQETIGEMIGGVEDIKLNGLEGYKVGKWEGIQKETFGINQKVLRLDQLQLTGFDLINQLKNIIVTYFAARLVIFGDITLGGMLSISYIIGQMNSPVSQLVAFMRSLQDARLSLSRLSEVQELREEDNITAGHAGYPSEVSQGNGIRLEGVCFQYEGPLSPFVLKDVNLFIPDGKTTAIVGASGSGKTTMLKLLLRFYELTSGEIYVDNDNISNIPPTTWREQCGVVMQDGFIFSETIARNIATKDIEIDDDRLWEAIRLANIEGFVNNLPMKENTMVGMMGNGMSAGQRQRLLIARAIYKRPKYFFLDEATSSLDTENEKIIQNNLDKFFKDRTVVVIAHRLSTVRNADNIVVLGDGAIVESGTHGQLIAKQGHYYNLVRNQLELNTRGYGDR